MAEKYQTPTVEEISTFTNGVLCSSTEFVLESSMENVGREEFEW